MLVIVDVVVTVDELFLMLIAVDVVDVVDVVAVTVNVNCC